MRQNRKPQGKGQRRTDQSRLLPVIMIPLIVIVLMIIIVIADHGRNAGETEAVETAVTQPETLLGDEPASESGETESGEAETAETEPVETEPENQDPFESENFVRDPVPEILDLMRSYFRARATADAQTMNQLYGIGEVSQTELAQQESRMRNNSKYVEDFEHIVTYVMDGTTADAWLVYALADIRFHAVKTRAPMVMYCYVIKDAEGTYRIVDSAGLSENILNFIDRANHSETVRRLASDVNVRLKEALNADEDLRATYGVLRDGSPVWEGEEEMPVVVIGEETTSAEGEASLSGEETTAAEPDISVETTAAQQ